MAIVVLGDSNAQGFYDDEKGGWVERLKQYMFRSNGSFVFNLAVSGYTSNHILALIHRDEITSRLQADDEYNLIILDIGSNDSVLIDNKRNLVSPEKYWSNIEDIKFLLHKKYGKYSGENPKGIQLLVVGPTNVNEEISNPVAWDDRFYYNNTEIAKYNKLLKDVCYPSLTPFLNMFEKHKFKTFDGVHLLPYEHDIVFKEVLTAVDQLI